MEAISSWEKVCDKNLLNFLLIRGSSLQRRMIVYICSFAFISGIIAASGPCWIKQEAEGLVPENPILILLNLSEDMDLTDIKPNRLSRAKYAVADILTEIKESQTGLMVYTDEPFLIVPLTEDGKIIDNLLPNVETNIMPAEGNRLDLALKLAIESFKNVGMIQGQMVVLTADAGQDFAKTLQQASIASSKGYTINIINIGTDNNDKLQKIADKGRGSYYNLNQVPQLILKLKNQKQSKIKESQNKISQWRDEGYYLCFIPLLCCLYLFRRGIFIIIFSLLLTTPAYAGFFLNDNQEGLEAFGQENYQKASEKFKESSWQASSYYRLGDYKKAYQKFSLKNDVESIYNQGNALAKMGKIEEAIKKYEKVLEQQPDHEDAKFNLEYLKQQQNSSQSSSNNNEQDDNNEQDQSSQQGAAPQSSDNQNQDNEKSQNGDNQNDSQQNQDQSSQQNQDNEQDKGEDKQSNLQQQEEAGQPQDQQDEQKEKSGSLLQKNEDDNTYNEEVQARELQYREIPEDPGGLLRAFMAKEYAKNRYAKDK